MSKITLILTIALIARLTLAIFLLAPQFKTHDDLKRYQDWGRIASEKGFYATYQDEHASYGIYANNQPPGMLYIAYFSYQTFHYFQKYFAAPSYWYNVIMKLPSISSDIGIGICIYLILKDKVRKKRAIFGSALFLFNPLVVYNSTVWGQTDSINNLLFLLALVCVYKKYLFLSVVFVMLSLYIKISLLPLVPLYLIYLLQTGLSIDNLTIKIIATRIAYIITGILILVILTIPVSNSPAHWLYNFYVSNSKGELQFITNYTFNFWSVIFNPDSFALVPKSDSVYSGLKLSEWAYLIFAAFMIPPFVFLVKSKKDDIINHLIKVLITAAYAAFLFLPRMHQHYIYPAIPLMAIYIAYRNKYYLHYLLIIFCNGINLYISYVPVPFLPLWFTNLIAHSKSRLSISFGITATFFVYYYQEWVQEKFSKYTKKSNL